MAVAVAEKKKVLDELKERREEILREIEEEGEKLVREFYKGAKRTQGTTFRRIVWNCRSVAFQEEKREYRITCMTHDGRRWYALRTVRKTDEMRELFERLYSLALLHKTIRNL